MRSVGGAGIGVLAWLLLPACFPMPPPDPGRPPPPPEMLPAPPPDPARTRPASSSAKAAAPPASEVDLEWDEATRTIRCGDAVALPVPRDLTAYVSASGDQITVAPPGSPPTGGLTVIGFDEIDESYPIDQLDELERRLAERQSKLAQALLGLHAMTGGWTTEAELHTDARTSKDGVGDAVIAADGASGVIWRLAFVQVQGCVFLAVELVRPDAAQRFAPMLERMCAGKRSRCRKESPISFPPKVSP